MKLCLLAILSLAVSVAIFMLFQHVLGAPAILLALATIVYVLVGKEQTREEQSTRWSLSIAGAFATGIGLCLTWAMAPNAYARTYAMDVVFLNVMSMPMMLILFGIVVNIVSFLMEDASSTKGV